METLCNSRSSSCAACVGVPCHPFSKRLAYEEACHYQTCRIQRLQRNPLTPVCANGTDVYSQQTLLPSSRRMVPLCPGRVTKVMLGKRTVATLMTHSQKPLGFCKRDITLSMQPLTFVLKRQAFEEVTARKRIDTFLASRAL